MSKTITSATKAAKLKVDMFKAVASIGTAFGDRYAFSFKRGVIEHGFNNYLDMPVVLAEVLAGKFLKHKKMSPVGIYQANRIFQESFAGTPNAGWAVDGLQVKCIDALDKFFRFMADNAENLECSVAVIRNKDSQTEEFHIYVASIDKS